MTRQAVVLLAILAAGCAAKPRSSPASPPAHDLSRADALLEAGCYRCLREAYDLYEAALAAPVPSSSARNGAFSTAVLLAIREKELGLPAAPWLDRAEALGLPGTQRYVDIVVRLPWTTAGQVPDFETPERLSAGVIDAWLAAPAAATFSLLEQYLAIALTCERGRPIDVATARTFDLTRRPLRYRFGLCGMSRRDHLTAVLAEDARFVEASFFIGRYEMTQGVAPVGSVGSRAWLTRALPPLREAHEGLPEAPVVTIVLADLMRSRTELVRALDLYDQALTLRPAQRDALLGRLITLTYLDRRDEAIAAATRMIQLGTWHVGMAYYWRSWNHYRSGRLEAAAADIAAARRSVVTDEVLALSGRIAYDQKRPIDARADLTGALNMNANHCMARWYAGLLDVDEASWADAVHTFATAGGCFHQAAESTRAEIAQLPEDLPAEARELQVASITESVTNSLQQAGRAFFNAAQAAMRLEDRPAAAAFARSAASYESMKERAEALLKALERN